MLQRWGWMLLCLFGVVLLLVACDSDAEPTAQPVIFLSATPRPSVTATFPPPQPTVIGTLTPTPCTGNPNWVDVYEVEAGDTLGAIALLSGTTVEALRTGNCLAGDDFVFVGQNLRVPNTFSLTLATDPGGAAGIIVFVSETASSHQLWAVRTNGSFPRALTQTGYVTGRPVRSPDLRQVAFRAASAFHEDALRTDEGIEVPGDIWLMNIDGSGLVHVVEQGPQDNIYRSLPVWSPDGTRLAFTEQRGEVGALVVIDTDGQNRRVVVTGDFAIGNQKTPITPAWSPDDDSIAVLMVDGDRVQAVLTGTELRSGVSDVLFETSIILNGPLWVPFNGLNGRPSVAVETIDLSVGRVWYVINPNTGAIERRTGGLQLVNATLEWRIAALGSRIEVYDGSGESVQTLDISIEEIAFSETDGAIVLGRSNGGLQYIGFDSPVEQRLFNDHAILPAWSEQRWIVLP